MMVKSTIWYVTFAQRAYSALLYITFTWDKVWRSKKCRSRKILYNVLVGYLPWKVVDDESLMRSVKRGTHLKPTNNSCLYLSWCIFLYFLFSFCTLLMLSFIFTPVRLTRSNLSSCQKNPRWNSFRDESRKVSWEGKERPLALSIYSSFLSFILIHTYIYICIFIYIHVVPLYEIWWAEDDRWLPMVLVRPFSSISSHTIYTRSFLFRNKKKIFNSKWNMSDDL